MIKIFEYKKDCKKIDTFIEYKNIDTGEVESTVRKIIDNIREKGDKALIKYTKELDGVKLSKNELRVSEEEIKNSVNEVDRKFLYILKKAKKNIINYHKRGLLKSFIYDDGDEVKLGKIIRPIESAGVYIPGGRAVYPSSVLMNVIPAQMAGVENIYVASPPDKQKRINKNILAACYILDIKNIFKMGGAQAVAAFAYGTESIPRVDKIVGPGNIYVATAKKVVFGDVDIDMFAGPSEVVVIADANSNPAYIASELLAQAEHDDYARSICLTTSKIMANKINEEIKKQIKILSRKKIIKESLKNNGAVIIADNLNTCVGLSNKIAPEHLQISVKNPDKIINSIKNAGAVFVGKFSPVAVGDYLAGPNHTLPTGGSARFSSPLNVNDFLKESSIVYYSRKRLEKVSGEISEFALLEGLDAHANAVNIRTKS
ncbi:histidinol dehydrogenase [candidate division KSB1 bacterium]